MLVLRYDLLSLAFWCEIVVPRVLMYLWVQLQVWRQHAILYRARCALVRAGSTLRGAVVVDHTSCKGSPGSVFMATVAVLVGVLARTQGMLDETVSA